MSHELRTPLNAVIGFSEALLRQGATSDAGRVAEFAAAINESGNHLLGLINTILDVARIEAGRFEMSADRIELARLLQTCTRSFTSAFLAGEIALRLDLPDQLPELRADERRLQQVLAGLLSNAVKFTPAGGEVTVGAALDPSGDLPLHVTDTGIGIPAADLDRVFEPFIQLDAALSRRFQGAGLGLYVARALVEAHGGRLRLLSEPGAGTRAEIALPGWRLDPDGSSREQSSVDEDVA
jgi:signal transduction histidine kinase